MNKFNLDRTKFVKVHAFETKKRKLTDDDITSLVGAGRDMVADRLHESREEIESARSANDQNKLREIKSDLMNEFGNMCPDMAMGHLEGVCLALNEEFKEIK